MSSGFPSLSSLAAHPTAATAQTASSGSSFHDGVSPPETNEAQPIPDTLGEPAVNIEGPFAEWGIPTPITARYKKPARNRIPSGDSHRSRFNPSSGSSADLNLLRITPKKGKWLRGVERRDQAKMSTSPKREIFKKLVAGAEFEPTTSGSLSSINDSQKSLWQFIDGRWQHRRISFPTDRNTARAPTRANPHGLMAAPQHSMTDSQKPQLRQSQMTMSISICPRWMMSQRILPVLAFQRLIPPSAVECDVYEPSSISTPLRRSDYHTSKTDV